MKPQQAIQKYLSQSLLSGNENELLVFMVFIASLLHAIVIIGVNFSTSRQHIVPPTLEITLASQPTELEQDNADFLAQADQQASGSTHETSMMSTDRISEFRDSRIRETNNQLMIKSTTLQQQVAKPAITTTANSPFVTETLQEDKRDITEELTGKDISTLIPDRTEIATLHARLDTLRQEYARRPRISTLTAVSTKSAAEAEYLYIWQEKIERLGNRYYPEEARSRGIAGSLRMLVSINHTGEVLDIRITQSSGHDVLDQAAIATVKLASPFPAFPPHLRQQADQIEIIRTWQFGKGSLSTR